MYIDTHTHLYASAFDEDREAMIQRAFDAGVQRLLMPNIDSRSIPGMYALEKQYPGKCIPMMGLHPCSVTENWEQELEQIRKELFSRPFIAVGEIGIDLYWEQHLLAEQKSAFAQQIEWAKELGLPIVIHARSSFEEIFEVLDQHNDERLRGIFHCFTGGIKEVEKIRTYGGFYFGIGGVLTFKKSGLDEVLANMKPEEVVLETDAPYLAPVPYRGKRNESAYLLHVAEKISDIWQIPVSTVGNLTTQNAVNCFALND